MGGDVESATELFSLLSGEGGTTLQARNRLSGLSVNRVPFVGVSLDSYSQPSSRIFHSSVVLILL